MTRRTRYILLSAAFIAFLISCAPAAATGTWTDETVNVGSLSYYAYYGTLIQGYAMTVQIAVVSGNDITLYIMDQTNYNSYSSGYSFYYLVSKPNVVSTSFNWQVPSTKTYYFVLDNKDSITSTSVHLKVTYEEPGVGDGSPTPPLGVLGLGLIIVIIVALVAVVVSRSKKGKSTAVEQVSEPARKVSARVEPVSKATREEVLVTGPGFCPHCGARITLPATFCKNCGASLEG